MFRQAFFEELQRELELTIRTREKAISMFRTVITLSKQAIMALHRYDSKLAQEKLHSATRNLHQATTMLSSYPDLVVGIKLAAYQEYAEAQILWSIIESETFPEPHHLNVPTLSFLLGLADAVGEFRRRALESLRQGKIQRAEKCLRTMDTIYSHLLPLENAYVLAPELRRKCDVARRLIELTLGDVATAAGRQSLEQAISRLEDHVSKR
ncbi:MAG: hypothetical protein JSV76_00675 [Candidatus Bathyarchaeota archaeon]|nr:MAG: hypothetical protein JSV76_00675 [Candidatus Bathyarchaeota archaeon]